MVDGPQPPAQHGTIGDTTALTEVEQDRSPQTRQGSNSEADRLRLAIRSAELGLWEWDLTSGQVTLSNDWLEPLGYTSDDIGSAVRDWLALIHPDDVETVRMQVDGLIEGASTRFDSEHRLRHHMGDFRWVQVTGMLSRDNNGRGTIVGTQRDITDRHRMQDQILRDALHDSLTGLANRVLFIDRVRQALNLGKRLPDAKFAVIYIDLGRFKVVNESMGHVHGDDLIIAAARRLAEGVNTGDTVARLGGDEFAILIDPVADTKEALSNAHALQKALSSPFKLGDREIFVTASMGIVHCQIDYARPEEVLRDAELAMYRAKNFGPGQSMLFDASMQVAKITDLDLDTDLRRAMDRDEIELYYQPIVTLSSGRISGFEALTRWTHLKHGPISPNSFIPLAEATGLIVRLGQWALRTACQQIDDWNQDRAKDDKLEISVNLSGRLLNQIDVTAEVMDSLRGSGLDGAQLKLEITERALIGNPQRSAAMLEALKKINVRVCVDDFGTGYSSLSYLHTFPIDTLKIDKSFVQDILRNTKHLEIVRTIVLLARNLRLDVIAEGVETADQLALLRTLGCQYAQGYYFSRPVDTAGAEALLASDGRG
jgi:diguanylate cyclase (GGDEF)-like protein/PAS domain S-box-containing protein